jgi:1-pyrroline-5-carboxylate dehydrogenase
MSLGYFSYPLPVNEPVLSYAPNSPERKRLKEVLAELKKRKADIPMYIGGKEVRTKNKISLHPPHELRHTLGYYYEGDEKHVQQAIDAALTAKAGWENMS